MSIGARIKHFRKEAGMTQAQLGEAVGLGESAIRNYERGVRTPKQDVVEAVADALRIAPESLVDAQADTARGALEIVFRIEGEYGLTPVETKSGMGIAIDPAARGAQKATAALKAWKRMRDRLDAGEVSESEYERWKASFKG